MAAIIFGIQKFHNTLCYLSFQINTDSSTFLQLKSLLASTGMVTHWQEKLSALDFTVCHCSGMQNTNANALTCREDAALPDPSAD